MGIGDYKNYSIDIQHVTFFQFNIRIVIRQP